MSAQNNQTNLNHLRKGGMYLAKTVRGVTVGEYLGMEAAYGERSVLLRNERGTSSIYRNDILSIERAA